MVVPKSASDVLRQLSPRHTVGTKFFRPNMYEYLREPSPAPAPSQTNGRHRSVSNSGRQRSASVKRGHDGAPSYSQAAGGGDTNPPCGTNSEILALFDSSAVEIAKIQSIAGKIGDNVKSVPDDNVIKGILADIAEAVQGISNVQGTLLAALQKQMLGEKWSQIPSGNSTQNNGRPSFQTQTLLNPSQHGSSQSRAEWAPSQGTQSSSQPAASQSGMTVLGTISKRHKSNSGIVTTITPATYQVPTPQVTPVTQAQQPTGQQQTSSNGQKGSGKQNPPKTEAEKRKDRFKQAVKEAESSLLIFNLNMGSYKTINPTTLNDKATLALTTMAAKNEGKKTSIPSDDAVGAIDDVLSMVKTVKFFGRTTKPYRKPGDKASGTFYTLPVRYEFQDRETRYQAEGILKSRCKIQTTTPYHPTLRDCIKQAVDAVKNDHPTDFVRVNVDTNNLALHLSHREQGENKPWVKYQTVFELPEEVLDVTAKNSPPSMTITVRDQVTKGRQSRKDSHDQDKGKGSPDKTKSPHKDRDKEFPAISSVSQDKVSDVSQDKTKVSHTMEDGRDWATQIQDQDKLSENEDIADQSSSSEDENDGL